MSVQVWTPELGTKHNLLSLAASYHLQYILLLPFVFIHTLESNIYCPLL